jgi:hypothetical protein
MSRKNFVADGGRPPSARETRNAQILSQINHARTNLDKAEARMNYLTAIESRDTRCRSIPFIRTVSLRLDHSLSRVSGTNSGKGWTLSLFLDHPAKEQNDDAITE